MLTQKVKVMIQIPADDKPQQTSTFFLCHSGRLYIVLIGESKKLM